jgi:UDP-N-acetylmuramoyl-tripeptide--D-alanyl-D-alanine ligase
VEDTLLALGQLAGHRRQSLDAVVVGITGSSGKTGTKELTRAALEGSRRVHATPGNLNNRIGLPLTLLDAPDDAEVVVLEMGTNEPGEIAALTRIAEPQIGVVTTVSETHIEKLESLEGVLEEKLDLLRGLPDDGEAIVGDEPSLLSERARRLRRGLLVVGLGARADAAHRADNASQDEHGYWSFVWRGEPVRLRVPGRVSVQNALFALTVAELVGVPAAEAVRGVGQVEAGSMRGEIKRIGGLTLIVDCYNANPQSVRAALDLLLDIEPGRPKVAVLGSMLELGGRSEELHTALLDEAAALGLDLLVATGGFARAAADTRSAESDSWISVEDPLEAYEALRGRLAGDEVLLLKASRGVALERLIPLLKNDFGGATPAPEELEA